MVDMETFAECSRSSHPPLLDRRDVGYGPRPPAGVSEAVDTRAARMADTPQGSTEENVRVLDVMSVNMWV